MPDKGRTGNILIDRFSSKEKFLMRSGWLAFMIVGVFGIYRQNPLWAYLYAAWGILGFSLVVLPFLCAHCPYPYQLSTCLFLPPKLIQRLYAYRGPQVSTAEKIASGAALAGMVVIPQFWLVRDIPLLVLFWIVGVPSMAAFPLHYCSRCRHHGCPMNNVKG